MRIIATLGVLFIFIVSVSFVHAATFGNLTEETSGFTVEDDLIGTQYVLTEDGTVTKMTAWLHIALDNSDNTALAKATIYSIADDTIIASSTSVAITGQTKAWYDFTFNQYLTAGTYWLLIAGDEDLDQVTMNKSEDAGVVSGRQTTLGTYPTLPSPWTPGADLDDKFAIYATYTADPVAATTTESIRISGDVSFGGDINISP